MIVIIILLNISDYCKILEDYCKIRDVVRCLFCIFMIMMIINRVSLDLIICYNTFVDKDKDS